MLAFRAVAAEPITHPIRGGVWQINRVIGYRLTLSVDGIEDPTTNPDDLVVLLEGWKRGAPCIYKQRYWRVTNFSEGDSIRNFSPFVTVRSA
jgi:hypothetical protein